MNIEIRRAFDFVSESAPEQAHVALVDRVWPRGLRKDELGLHEWARHLAPSPGLRQWFRHDPDKWSAFRRHYQAELEHHTEELQRLRQLAEERPLVLLYGARERQYNHAVALKQFLERPPRSLAA